MAKFGAKVTGLKELLNSFDDVINGIGDALNDELRVTTEKAHREITSSTRRPYLTGFTRKSTGHVPGKEVYSTLAWARIWEFGGTVSPRGHAITFPKTEWMSRPVIDAFEDIDQRLGDRFDVIVK